MTFIKDFIEGTKLTQEQFLIASVNKSTATNGALYARLTLKDSTGAITAVKWQISKVEEDFLKVGVVVSVDGYVEFYRTQPQIRIDIIRLVNEDEYDLAKLTKTAPVSEENLLNRLEQIISSIKDEEYKAIVQYIYKEKKEAIIASPAAISVHHEFAPLGLLYHIVSMAECALFLSSHYEPINKNLLLAGVLLHDIAKTIELQRESLSFTYSLEGKLIGHISLMVSYVDEVCKKLNIDQEKTILIKHMILSHHGQLEFGSPVLPQIKEAILLHMIDDIDAKMMVVDKALADIAPGQYSQKVMPLDNRILYKPTK